MIKIGSARAVTQNFTAHPQTKPNFKRHQVGAPTKYSHHHARPWRKCTDQRCWLHRIVLQPHLPPYTHEENLVTAGAGVDFGTLINYGIEHKLLGLEEFSGIPGSVGGSVFINIHYFEFLLSKFLVHARVIHQKTGDIMTVDQAGSISDTTTLHCMKETIT